MEEQLRDALRKYEENLQLFPVKPADDKTAQAKLEIKEAMNEIRELLRELESSQQEDTEMETEHRGQKRKHKPQTRKTVEEHQVLTEYLDKPVDFYNLAKKYPSFEKHVWSSGDGCFTMNFADPSATLELTRVLLKEYYDLDWEIPLGQLVPPIPCRAKYVSWIDDLLQLSSPAKKSVIGVDVGCGANCIYPLLGASIHGWKFVGTDITEIAVQYANNNKNRNPKISHLIEIFQIPQDCSEILIPVVQHYGNFHFSMCNPPFFAAIEEGNQNQRTAFGGTHAEMVYPGGELAFVEKIVDESIQLQDRIHWYTVMLGKKTTFKQIRSRLYAIGVAAVRTSTLVQGKITRWTIAWSFAAKHTDQTPLRQTLPASNLIFSIRSQGRSSEALLQCLKKTMEAHGGVITHQTETKLLVRFPGSMQEEKECSVEVLPETTESLLVMLSEKAPFPQDLFAKLWEDVKILWSNPALPK